MKQYAGQLAPMLSYIYQQSLDRGEVPLDWRKAHVVPIFKKGDRSKPENYRPISLTSISCKIFEHILVSNVMDHMDTNNLFSDFQHGFRHNRSCESQLFLTVHDLVSSLDKKQQVDMAVLDFSKAFDKVPHQRLAAKLDYYCIRGHTKEWVCSFLADRKQQVVVDGSKSTDEQVLSGVPQGSVVGPVLFLIYINDMADNINSSIRLFADDCILYRVVTSDDDHHSLQADLDKLHQWSLAWQMTFNIKKCFTMSVTNARKKKRYWTYNMGGEDMALTDSTPYLGITISKTLKWNQHVDIITAKANKILGLLCRNLKHTPEGVKTAAYQTLVRPRLEYCSSIWSPHQQQLRSQIEGIQRRAARFVLNKPYHRSEPDSVTDMLRSLKWDSLEKRRHIHSLTFMYKTTHGLVAIPAAYHPIPWRTASRYSASHSFLPYHTHVDAYKYSLLPRTVLLWNALPVEVPAAPSLDAFKARVHKVAF
jgi:hypothetical protein